jgi:sirohydrochlorin ferrochelatase
MTHVVLLAHGSRDPRSAVAVRRAAAAIAHRVAAQVRTAFLDHDQPRLGEAVADASSDDDVVVLPLLLSTAFHARVDVPAAVAALPRPVTLLDPIGHPAFVLDELLRRGGEPTVVVSAGTTVDDERAVFADAVAAASWRTGVPAVAAYATGPGPRLPAIANPGRTAVVPWLLAPGRLLDGVLADATTARCAIVSHGLLDEPAFRDAVASRLSGALRVSASAGPPLR